MVFADSFDRSEISNLQPLQSSSAHFSSIFRDSSNEMLTPLWLMALLLFLVQRSRIEQSIQLVLQFTGCKLKLWLPRFVIQRYRRAIGNRLREIVN
jgi:hypothetical protein